MIIHTNQTSKKKPQNTPEKQQLRQDWDKLLQKYETKAYAKPKATKTRKPEPYRRETKHYPSLDTGRGSATVAESKAYTGDATPAGVEPVIRIEPEPAQMVLATTLIVFPVISSTFIVTESCVLSHGAPEIVQTKT